MKLEECFKLLGVDPSASSSEIKQAYRKLARKIHPDSPGSSEDKNKAEEDFKRLNTAYIQVLKANQQPKIRRKSTRTRSKTKPRTTSTTSFMESSNRGINNSIDQIFDDMMKRISTLFGNRIGSYENRNRSTRWQTERRGHRLGNQRSRCHHSPFVVCLRCRQI